MVSFGKRFQIILHEPQDTGPSNPIRHVEQRPIGRRRLDPVRRDHARHAQQADDPPKELLVVGKQLRTMPLQKRGRSG